MPQIHDFVISRSNQLGIGKITVMNGAAAVVEYFHSVGRSSCHLSKFSDLKLVKPTAQTRCYIRRTGDDGWTVGRMIGHIDATPPYYRIALTEGRVMDVKPADLYVRSAEPIDDAMEILLHRGQETPYFQERRKKFLACLVEQRKLAQGMSGLLSSGIELYQHQFEVIRRVLSDPVQRYLLADEVGLGKTIEAGVILRQFLLDHPDHKALIIVPRLLRGQWTEELKGRLLLGDYLDRAKLISDDGIDQIGPSEHFDLIIIDEAHHVAAKAFSSNANEQAYFDRIRTLAHEAPRLLLLSATPVLNHERDFLAMLHLLDPTLYGLDDIDDFRQRVSGRQAIGRVLLQLREGINPLMLKLALPRLKSTFADDNCAVQQLEYIERLVGATELDRTALDYEIRRLRVHISEAYRLHRRLLRNRRSTIEDGGLQARHGVRSEYELDERAETLEQLLNEWRENTIFHLQAYQAESQARELYIELFMTLCEILEAHSVLHDALATRLGRGRCCDLAAELGPKGFAALTGAPILPDERQILERMIEVLDEPSENGDRLELLVKILKNNCKDGEKAVIFTQFTRVARLITQRLGEEYGEAAVCLQHHAMSARQAEVTAAYFRKEACCRFFVLDRSGEEGINLQCAQWLIHYDLPWAPNRIEQRIGRLDRIGMRGRIRSCALVGSDCEQSLHDAWFTLLNEGFCVFDDSIASLQFYIDNKMPELTGIAFELGGDGLTDQLEIVKKQIQEEKISIEEQYILDEINIVEQNEGGQFEQLELFDQDSDAIRNYFEPWIVEALHMKRDQSTLGLVSYEANHRTLISNDFIRDNLECFTNVEGTYDRLKATHRSGAPLYRIGHPFIDIMEKFVRWDDRGQAYAMWRLQSGEPAEPGNEKVFFQFCFLLEADTAAAARVYQRSSRFQADAQALQRKADAFLPPEYIMVHLDSSMDIVTDPTTLSVLLRPYDKLAGDLNLGGERLHILDSVIDPNHWPVFCKEAREAGERLALAQEDLRRTLAQREDAARRKMEASLSILELRLRRAVQSKSAPSALQAEMELEQRITEALLEGIRKPHLRLDSVGLIIVAGYSPE